MARDAFSYTVNSNGQTIVDANELFESADVMALVSSLAEMVECADKDDSDVLF
jgi:hypothetical protein